ncbi:MAG: hypothetical protein ACE5LS_07325 [Thermoplasmata archaeon]
MGNVGEEWAWAVVAVDRLGSSLDRLARFLPKRRRRRLAEGVFLDVVQAIRESRLLAEIVLATRDPTAASLGQREGISCPKGEGASALPIRQAVEASLQEGAEAMALLWGDLPLLEAQDLAFLMGRLAQGPRMVLVPTLGSPGVSIVMARPASVLPPGDFETGDASSWQQEARRHGLATEVYGLPAGMRPRAPRDLLQVYKAPRPSRAKALLKEWRMGPRLRESKGEES